MRLHPKEVKLLLEALRRGVSVRGRQGEREGAQAGFGVMNMRISTVYRFVCFSCCNLIATKKITIPRIRGTSRPKMTK